jgi:tripartite-type tricarboxylate transporter receptor subunit TctC
MKRNGWIILAVVTAAAIVPAHAQKYPDRPIRVIVPFAAGSTSDSIMRYVQPHMSTTLGQQMVVDNRPGAAGNLGAILTSQSAPDGYTVMLGNIAQSVSMSLYSRPGYHLVKDFAPVTQLVAGSYMMVVHPSVPAKSVKEFIALAKKQPGAINVGTAGATIRLSAKLLDSLAGTKLTEVGYKSSPQLITALVSGEASVGFPPSTSALPQVKAGRLRGLAVTSGKRSPLSPDLPTVGESLPGYDVTGWYGLVVPAGTSKAIIGRLHSAALGALAQEDVKKRYMASDLLPVGGTPEQFAALIRTEVAKWAKVIKEAGMRVD